MCDAVPFHRRKTGGWKNLIVLSVASLICGECIHVCTEPYLFNVHSYKTRSLASNKLAVRHFVCCSGTYSLLSQRLGETVADTRPFALHYFIVQTMDFNYQYGVLSATAPSSAMCLGVGVA